MISCAVGASFLLAWLSHHLIENPARRHPRLQASVRLNLVLGAALTLVPVVAGAIILATMNTGDEEIQVADSDGTVVVGMSPTEAAADKVTLSIHCHSAAWNDTTVPDDCVFGDPIGDKTVVLAGDSHARQWLPALDLIGRNEGWRVIAWTKSAPFDPWRQWIGVWGDTQWLSA